MATRFKQPVEFKSEFERALRRPLFILLLPFQVKGPHERYSRP